VSIIAAIWETDGRIMSEAKPGQKLETLSEKIKKQKMAGVWPSKWKALSSKSY
jgi:hypothetical protein